MASTPDDMAALRQQFNALDDWADTVDAKLAKLAGTDQALARLDETTAALIERLTARIEVLERQGAAPLRMVLTATREDPNG